MGVCVPKQMYMHEFALSDVRRFMFRGSYLVGEANFIRSSVNFISHYLKVICGELRAKL